MKLIVKIEPKYCGPTESGNGGYVSGILAKAAHFPAQVTLRQPPPLNKKLDLIVSNEKVELLDGETLVAEAVPHDLDIDIPEPPTYEEAIEASKNYPGFQEHPFPDCFVCGTNRAENDGLRLFTGKVKEGMMASPWLPSPTLSSDGKFIDKEHYYSALDCPGSWNYHDASRRIVLGRISAKIIEKVEVGQSHIVIGWPISEEGRKFFTGTAIFKKDGTLCAVAKATWIALK